MTAGLTITITWDYYCSHVIEIVRPGIIHPCHSGSSPDEVDVNSPRKLAHQASIDSERYPTS